MSSFGRPGGSTRSDGGDDRLVVGLAVAVALLAVLVAGLLRANAEVMQAMHRWAPTSAPARPVQHRGATHRSPDTRPPRRTTWSILAGVRRGETPQPGWWRGAARHPGSPSDLGLPDLPRLLGRFPPGDDPGFPGGARLVVVTRAGSRVPRYDRQPGRPALSVVMSTQAWEHYDIPYAPYFVYVSGPAGRVVGRGCRRLGRGADPGRQRGGRRHDDRPAGGLPRSRADHGRTGGGPALEAAGIEPGDPRLYPASIDGAAPSDDGHPPDRGHGPGRHCSAGMGGDDLPAPGGARRTTYPVLHAATLPCPPTGVTTAAVWSSCSDRKTSSSPCWSSARGGLRPLFLPLRAVPGLTPDAFRPQQLQRTIRGQAGVQRFFSAGGGPSASIRSSVRSPTG